MGNRNQCIFKVVKHISSGTDLKRIFQEIAIVENDDIQIELDDTSICKGHGAIQSICDNWARDLERKIRDKKRNPRYATHILLSIKVPVNKETLFSVNFAARDFLYECFGKLGYQYAFINRVDASHPIIRIILKNYNRELDKKLHIPNGWVTEMRESWASYLCQYNIEAVA